MLKRFQLDGELLKSLKKSDMVKFLFWIDHFASCVEDGFEGDKTGGSSPGERWWASELRHWL